MEPNKMETFKKKTKKGLRISAIVLVAALAVFIYVKFYFVWGEGVKTGELNYVVYKGYIFKTYEGKLIQTGIRGASEGGIQSNEFEFSIADEAVAKELQLVGGQEVDLSYKEYLGALPWRGNSRYVVDKIISIKPKSQTPVIP